MNDDGVEDGGLTELLNVVVDDAGTISGGSISAFFGLVCSLSACSIELIQLFLSESLEAFIK